MSISLALTALDEIKQGERYRRAKRAALRRLPKLPDSDNPLPHHLKRARKATITDPAFVMLTFTRVITDLKSARTNLRNLGAPNAADYVASALKSVQGAYNHAKRVGRAL